MKDVILTTDLYHRHADPNDHWNLASMFALSTKGWINFSGIMCDDDRSIAEDGSFLHFGDPSVQSIAQLNYITGNAVPVGFGSRLPIKKKEDLDEVLKSKKKISSVTLLLETLQQSKNKVDIHMCGSCKDVLIAFKLAPDLFEKKCDRIFVNAGTYAKQDPIEYNVSLEPYAFSQIFKIPCKIMWSPCFDELIPYPYKPSKRANYYEINQSESLPFMSDAVKKYFNYMYGAEFKTNWLSYLREPIDMDLLHNWSMEKRQMWSTPGFLLSAEKFVTENGEIVDTNSGLTPVFDYKPINIKVQDNGKLEWFDTQSSNIYMFENTDPLAYQTAMGEVVKSLMSFLPDI
ncbi:MAG: hypothetical protein IJA13_02025 [Clostridia bacterium]|nr:hypothetical protein [Clostridia bacterium]